MTTSTGRRPLRKHRRDQRTVGSGRYHEQRRSFPLRLPGHGI